MNKIRVAVLMGGTSAERAISLSTGRQILAALDREKYIPMALDAAALKGGSHEPLPAGVTADVGSSEIAPLRIEELSCGEAGAKPDVVFIALHGKGGEDGTIQGMLELLGIPYTGSGVLASALAMDKALTKKLLRAEGIAVPQDIVLKRHSSFAVAELSSKIQASFGFPVIVKPNAQGSTIGCHVVREPSGLDEAIEDAFRFDPTVLVEQFLTGTEITAGVLGNEKPEALPLIEIITGSGFYDYHAKYSPGGSSHIIPARISEAAAQTSTDYALRCHALLGCRGMSRTDLMVVGDQPYVLEINTIPGMTPTSLLPDAARAAGISFAELLDMLIVYALE